MADIAGDVAANPDAQAAVTDFLDYTEYLPADLIRSLTLIRGLDETYLQNAQAIHNLTKVYGTLPTLPSSSKPDGRQLRTQISSHLDQALNARESAYAEACRLSDLADRHQNRLKSIIAKLNALPKPPSRDPTPQPQQPSSAKRPRSGRKIENTLGSTRLTLKPPKGPTILLKRPTHRRITVPGDVRPPYDPDEPIASTEASDLESDRDPSPVRPVIKLKQPKPPKLLTEAVERKPRETVTYRKPTPPPEEADIGGKYRPWTHLTEYEMYRLRKKMKKNHQWDPSEVMIRRELAEKGRGWDNYYKAKAEAKANGTKFIDIGDEDKSPERELEKVETPKTAPLTIVTPSASSSKPKTAKKTETKKEKKDEPPPNRQAIAAQEAELAARRLGDLGSTFKNLFPSNLFSPVSNALGWNRGSSTPASAQSPGASKKPAAEKSQKKRKIEETVTSESPSAEPDTQKQKKQKLTIPILKPATNTQAPAVSAGTIKIPLKLHVTSQTSPTSAVSTPLSASRAVSAQRSSVAPKTESSPPPPDRSSSRRSTALSAEPAPVSARPSRHASATPVATNHKTSAAENTTPKTVQTAASRRPKRDAPGTVTQSSQDGGAAVSVSERKAKPSKQKAAAVPVAKVVLDAEMPQIRIDIDGKQEIVDPDEERYCICGDVSYGEMICCELDEKCDFGQWFHMECIALVDLPPRTVKWFCPGDRKKYHKGENSNGLVGRGY